MTDPKATLKDYLQGGRESLVWKLDGLSERDVRRPLVPSGTNLLGLVKHNAHTELVYFGETFGRPCTDVSMDVRFDVDPNADMWATADESRDDIVALYRRVWAHSDETLDALDLGAVGHVPHWPAGSNEITLHRALVHVVVDLQRHAGQADILREQIDGAAGLLQRSDNLPSHDPAFWSAHRDRLQRLADSFADDRRD